MIGTTPVTYQTAAAGSLDRKNIASTTYTDSTIYGSLQPLDVKEDVTNIDYTIERWQFITYPTPVALKAKATDRLIDPSGQVYRVFGAKIQPRANGAPQHVQIFLENPSGLNEPA